MNSIQYNEPLFVRSQHRPVVWQGKSYGFQELFPWLQLEVPEEVVTTLYNNDQLYHDKTLETKNKVGDRLHELDRQSVDKLIDRLNLALSKRGLSDAKTREERCRKTTAKDLTRQFGLIKSWLNRNPWAVDDFHTIRDEILDDQYKKTPQTQEDA